MYIYVYIYVYVYNIYICIIYIYIFICRRPSSNMYGMKCYVFCWVWEIYNELDNSSHLQILHSIILDGFLRCENQGT